MENPIAASIGGRTFNLQLAKTQSEHTRGLSGRDSLDGGTGMLFVFDDADFRHFWMKDMRFSLDIAFLDANHVIVDIKRHAKPCEENHCPTLDSRAKATYVLEVNAGDLDGAKVGDKAILSSAIQ